MRTALLRAVLPALLLVGYGGSSVWRTPEASVERLQRGMIRVAGTYSFPDALALRCQLWETVNQRIRIQRELVEAGLDPVHRPQPDLEAFYAAEAASSTEGDRPEP